MTTLAAVSSGLSLTLRSCPSYDESSLEASEDPGHKHEMNETEMSGILYMYMYMYL